jgi:predicted ATPase/class 3 adenylate cyclase
MTASGIEERRLITILFADLSGFTALSSTLDPEDVRDVASTSFEFLNKPIVKEGGTIHKYEGDLVIALFGFPVSHEDDPERAVRAALEMMKLLPDINAAVSAKLKRRTDLGLHVGINSGTVVVGEIGSREKREYTIMGDAVNLTSRLKDIAQTGEIIVSDPVFRASRYLFDYEARPAVAVKGIAEPVRIFRPQQLKEHPEPKRGIKGITSPTVGREKEMAILKDQVGRLSRGRGGVCFVLGGAGLGKSRLLEELKKYIENDKLPVTVLEGRCLSYGENITYWPLLLILESLFGVTENDTRKIFQEKLVKKAKEIFPETWHEHVPYLGYLFSIRFSDESDEKVKYLDAQELKVQIRLTIKKMLEALARVRPLLLVIDDYHWIDRETLELLEFLFAPSVPGATDTAFPPILLLALSRIEKDVPPYQTREALKKARAEDYREIILTPLPEEATSRMLYNLLNIPGFTEGFKDKIQIKAEGNPFYIEEIVRALIDSGVLLLDSGVWRLTADVKALPVPNTVQAVILSRLDKLEHDVRDVLQMAAVVGRNFYAPVLEQLCGLDSLMLSVVLATLEDYEYITESKKEPENEYAFRHPLLQEVAYGSLLIKRRRELHRKVGDLIERLYPDRRDEFTEILAYQYAASDDKDKAREWLLKAGRKAKDRYANDEAIRYFQKVVELNSPEGADSAVELAVVFEALGDIACVKGENDAALKYYDEVYRLAQGDKITAARAQIRSAEVHNNRAEYRRALELLEIAGQDLTGATAREAAELAEIGVKRSDLYSALGDVKRAIREAEQALETADRLARDGQVEPKAIDRIRNDALNHLGWIYREQGDYDRAIEYYRKAQRIAEAAGDKGWIARSFNNLGVVYKDKNDYSQAVDFFDKCLKVAQAIGFKGMVGAVNLNLGTVYSDLGEYDRTIELYQNYLAICQETGDKHGAGMAYNNLGIVYKDRGDYDRAIECYATYLRIAEEIGSKSGIGAASSNMGIVYSALGEYEKAIALFERQRIISEEINSRIGQAAAHANLGGAYQYQGDFERARIEYEKSMEISLAVGEKQGIGLLNTCLAGLYLETGEPVKAEDYYREAERIGRAIGDKTMLIEILNGLAQLKQAKSDAKTAPDPDALAYAQEALKYSGELKTRTGIASSHLTLGILYAAAWDHEKAGEYFRESIKTLTELREKKTLADAYFEYAKMLKAAAKKGSAVKDEAGAVGRKARQIYAELKLDHKIKEIDQFGL